mmetsp:Transcript_18/g.58  ORF Transcript_18/g.58 Transcript_18/m.58 type:complete len:212 (+) Transcript_18:152-787(+)
MPRQVQHRPAPLDELPVPVVGELLGAPLPRLQVAAKRQHHHAAFHHHTTELGQYWPRCVQVRRRADEGGPDEGVVSKRQLHVEVGLRNRAVAAHCTSRLDHSLGRVQANQGHRHPDLGEVIGQQARAAARVKHSCIGTLEEARRQRVRQHARAHRRQHVAPAGHVFVVLGRPGVIDGRVLSAVLTSPAAKAIAKKAIAAHCTQHAMAAPFG